MAMIAIEKNLLTCGAVGDVNHQLVERECGCAFLGHRKVTKELCCGTG